MGMINIILLFAFFIHLIYFSIVISGYVFHSSFEQSSGLGSDILFLVLGLLIYLVCI